MVAWRTNALSTLYLALCSRFAHLRSYRIQICSFPSVHILSKLRNHSLDSKTCFPSPSLSPPTTTLIFSQATCFYSLTLSSCAFWPSFCLYQYVTDPYTPRSPFSLFFSTIYSQVLSCWAHPAGLIDVIYSLVRPCLGWASQRPRSLSSFFLVSRGGLLKPCVFYLSLVSSYAKMHGDTGGIVTPNMSKHLQNEANRSHDRQLHFMLYIQSIPPATTMGGGMIHCVYKAAELRKRRHSSCGHKQPTNSKTLH